METVEWDVDGKYTEQEKKRVSFEGGEMCLCDK